MASSSHLPTVSSGRPPSFLAGNGNFQPSQYSNSSGKPESPRRPPISQPDADQPVWEDGASGIEHPPQSFSDATAMYRNNTSTYGTFGTGTTFAGRRPFKIHRGRPSSTKRPLPNGIVTQANGILSPGEAADGSHQETSPTRGFNNVDPPLPSPPLQIRPISSEVGHTERVSPSSSHSLLPGAPPLRAFPRTNSQFPQALSSYNEKRQVHFESPPEELIVHYD
ncbi:hypothetical protein FRC17_008534 [Serendipita sp. 399]|nr:hypothetical protein FRC17_008534 [Serendipita sp. 399]